MWLPRSLDWSQTFTFHGRSDLKSQGCRPGKWSQWGRASVFRGLPFPGMVSLQHSLHFESHHTKTVRKEDGQNCFRKWQAPWDKCIQIRAEYFEGKEHQQFSTVITFSYLSTSCTFWSCLVPSTDILFSGGTCDQSPWGTQHLLPGCPQAQADCCANQLDRALTLSLLTSYTWLPSPPALGEGSTAPFFGSGQGNRIIINNAQTSVSKGEAWAGCTGMCL